MPTGPGSASTIELDEHGGYLCAGCKRSWTSFRSLNFHRRAPAMRGTECEQESSSRELRNVYRPNLATGFESRLPVLPAAGTARVALPVYNSNIEQIRADQSK